MIISNVVIHRRTFEGKTDLSKNDSPITSKYSPSKKYAVAYDIEGFERNPCFHCATTKTEALAYVKELENKNFRQRAHANEEVKAKFAAERANTAPMIN